MEEDGGGGRVTSTKVLLKMVREIVRFTRKSQIRKDILVEK